MFCDIYLNNVKVIVLFLNRIQKDYNDFQLSVNNKPYLIECSAGTVIIIPV